MVRSSLGPLGLDRMMVDSIGVRSLSACRCSCTDALCLLLLGGHHLQRRRDGATILSLLNVENPAGRIFVELAQKQDKEVGDGTTSVVLIAPELLRRPNELVKHKIHPTTIITGYR